MQIRSYVHTGCCVFSCIFIRSNSTAFVLDRRRRQKDERTLGKSFMHLSNHRAEIGLVLSKRNVLLCSNKGCIIGTQKKYNQRWWLVAPFFREARHFTKPIPGLSELDINKSSTSYFVVQPLQPRLMTSALRT